jgi:hypothetical protein
MEETSSKKVQYKASKVPGVVFTSVVAGGSGMGVVLNLVVTIVKTPDNGTQGLWLAGTVALFVISVWMIFLAICVLHQSFQKNQYDNISRLLERNQER